jgi:hypothetical protein
MSDPKKPQVKLSDTPKLKSIHDQESSSVEKAMLSMTNEDSQE